MLGCNGRAGNTTAINYFSDSSFEPSVRTFEWGPRESFAYIYTLCGRGDPIMTDEQFKRAVPGGTHNISDDWVPSWPYGHNSKTGTYKNFWEVEGELEGKTAQQVVDECIERFHDFVDNHAETVYNYLCNKGQIITIENDALWFALTVWTIKNNRLGDLQPWTIERTREQMIAQHKELLERTLPNHINYNSGEIYKDQSVRNFTITDKALEEIQDYRESAWVDVYEKKGNWGKGIQYVDFNKIKHIDNKGTIEQFHANLKTAFDEYNTKYGI
jgi:hypothetical protein